MNKMLKVTILIVVVLSLIASVITFIQFKKSDQTTEEEAAPENGLSITDNLFLLPESPISNLKTKGAIKEIYLLNKETKEKELVISSDIPLMITHLNKDDKIVQIKNNHYFVTYEFTETVNGKNEKNKKNEHGTLVKISSNGEFEKIYTSKDIFESAKSENDSIVFYEKILLDDMNVYPSYYKPYIRVKKVFDGNTFKEVSRVKVDPRES